MTPEELLKEVGEPVAARRKVAMWQGGDDYKYEWAVVKEHTPGTEPLYTSDQVAAAIGKLQAQLTAAKEDLKRAQNSDEANFQRWQKAQEQLTTAEQRVAEACADACRNAPRKSGLDLPQADDCSAYIRSGEWRKFMKEV